MQKFKTIREAMTMSPYAIGMAQAKKMYGYGKGPATDLPKKVIKKAHDIAKRIKANESFEDIIEDILQEETPKYSDAYPDPSSYGHQELKNAHKLYKGLKSKGTKDVAYTMRLAQELEKRKKAESVDLTDKNEKEKGVSYKGMGTDVASKKKKLNPSMPLTQKDRQVKDYMEEVEDLDELSKNTLANYAMKASTDAVKNQRKQSNYQRVGDDDDEAPGTQKLYTRMANKAGEKKVKRLSGIATALSKLAKEEVEDLDEVSKKLLHSYVNKAAFDVASNAHAVASAGSSIPKIQKPLDQLNKRLRGIDKAAGKMAKEEVEDLDELSKKTLGSYVNKAVTSVHNLGYNAGTKMASGDVNTGMKSAINSIKRQTNINTAVKKLAKEEVEEIDELSRNTMSSYMNKASDASKYKGLSTSKVDKRYSGVAQASKKLDKMNQSASNMAKEAKEEMPTGIKIYHKNKDTGQEGSAIQFTVKNAQSHIKDLQKAGHKVTGKALMFGKKEGPRKPMNEDKLEELKKSTYTGYINRASRSLRATASIEKDFERDAERDVNRAYKSGIEPAEKERHLKNYEVNKGLAADFGRDSEKRLKGIERATKKLSK